MEGVQQLESEMIALTSCGMTVLAILTAQEKPSVVGMDASLRVLSQVSRTVSSHSIPLYFSQEWMTVLNFISTVVSGCKTTSLVYMLTGW